MKNEWEQLPFLLRLIDDPSPTVREKVATRLRELGTSAKRNIWQEIEAVELSLSPTQRHALREALAPDEKTARRSAVPAAWPQWLQHKTENERLEAAFAWLAHWRHGDDGDERLHAALDELAREYLSQGGIADPEELSVFLFDERGFAGAPAEEYYLPQQSDLLAVIQSRRGLPLSLAAIFILVGWRLDVIIYGCNFPGHFLTRAPIPGAAPASYHEQDLIFDPFHGGRILPPEEVAALRKVAPHELSTPAPAATIIARVLLNLANAFHHQNDAAGREQVLTLWKQLEAALPRK